MASLLFLRRPVVGSLSGAGTALLQRSPAASFEVPTVLGRVAPWEAAVAERYHEPVMLAESLSFLNVRAGGAYIDGTAGEGGHSELIIRAAQPGGRLLALDLDAGAVGATRERLAGDPGAVVAQASYATMATVAHALSFDTVDGVLLDLGLSSRQLEAEGRGFSFLRDEPLDMRFDAREGATAADLVNDFPEAELASLIFHLGEESRSRAIARAIVRARPLQSSAQLAQVVAGAVGGQQGRTHPATRTFQALRIAVNQELENIAEGLEQAIKVLGPGGRVVVVSYHSLEDRIVKEFMRRESRDCICSPGTPECVCGHTATVRVLTKKIVTATPAEVARNPRSRSAKLRAAERL